MFIRELRKPDGSLGRLSLEQIALVLEVWADRTRRHAGSGADESYRRIPARGPGHDLARDLKTVLLKYDGLWDRPLRTRADAAH